MSDQRTEQVDTGETGSRQLKLLEMRGLLLGEAVANTEDHEHSCYLFKKALCSKRRKQPKMGKVSNLGILIFALLTLSRVIVGLSLIHDVPTDGRRRLHRRHGSECRSRRVFTIMMTSDGKYSEENDPEADGGDDNESKKDKQELIRRVTQLEELVARQEVEIQRLKRTCDGFAESLEAFTQVIQILRDAGRLESDPADSESIADDGEESSVLPKSGFKKVIESFDDAVIFGTAPSSVTDAADAAGAAILAAMLGGKQRMLIDVRDAELSTDSETLVQFIELAILPIAVGLEGLKSTRNRLKIVFPKVSQLLEYRRTMALAAPEVVALSTLGFEPVEKRDKLVVLVAPAPDDSEGLAAMGEMLAPSDPEQKPIQQPIVVLNHHMVPVANLPGDFEKAYHLRLLSVQYMSGGDANEYFQNSQKDKDVDQLSSDEDEYDEILEDENDDDDAKKLDDEALEAAMQHAHEAVKNIGLTRAMVIRAYPRPWHVFVDVSPDTDAAFEVAAIFDDEPTMEEINFAIVECLEGSEREDEIVAQQMQQALEDGQLENVSNMIEEALDQYTEDDDDDSDNDDDDFDMFEEDSV